MPTPYDRPDGSRELYQPFDCNERVAKALVTVAAFVALADGRLQTIERDEAVQYIFAAGLTPGLHHSTSPTSLRNALAAYRMQTRHSGSRCRSAGSGAVAHI